MENNNNNMDNWVADAINDYLNDENVHIPVEIDQEMLEQQDDMDYNNENNLEEDELVQNENQDSGVHELSDHIGKNMLFKIIKFVNKVVSKINSSIYVGDIEFAEYELHELNNILTNQDCDWKNCLVYNTAEVVESNILVKRFGVDVTKNIGSLMSDAVSLKDLNHDVKVLSDMVYIWLGMRKVYSIARLNEMYKDFKNGHKKDEHDVIEVIEKAINNKLRRWSVEPVINPKYHINLKNNWHAIIHYLDAFYFKRSTPFKTRYFKSLNRFLIIDI